MTFKEINKSLKGKVSKEERFFRCIITHLIQTEGIQSLYNMKKFCNYLILIGEKDGGEMFILLKNKREDFLKNTQDIILKHLMVVK
jgi:hypothetical protein